MACGIPGHKICRQCWQEVYNRGQIQGIRACLHCKAPNTGRYSRQQPNFRQKLVGTHKEDFKRNNAHKKKAKPETIRKNKQKKMKCRRKRQEKEEEKQKKAGLGTHAHADGIIANDHRPPVHDVILSKDVRKSRETAFGEPQSCRGVYDLV